MSHKWRARGLKRGIGLRPRGLALSVLLAAMAGTANAQTPSEDVAAQIRQQGYACNQPVTAHRDVGRSRPDSAVWVLACRDAAYRVRLSPDMAARVTRLKPHRSRRTPS